MDDQKLTFMAKKFRKRALLLRLLAYAVLSLIGVALAGGIYIFVIAGELVSREAVKLQTEIFKNLKDQLTAAAPITLSLLEEYRYVAQESGMVTVKLSSTLDESKVALEEIGKAAKIYRTTGAHKKDPEITKKLDTIIDSVSDEEMWRNLKMIVSRLNVMFDNLVYSSEELKDAVSMAPNVLESLAGEKAGSASVPVLVSTLTTRIGSLLILIFLVQILINLYRYNIRLSALFDARADAIEIIDSDSSKDFTLIEIITALSPDNLDFGKSPPSPAQHAVDLAKEILTKQKS